MHSIVELEIWARNLNKHLQSKNFINAVSADLVVTNLSDLELNERLRKRKVERVSRNGRDIVISFKDNHHLFFYVPRTAIFHNSNVLNSSTRLLLNFSDFSLKINDIQKKSQVSYYSGDSDYLYGATGKGIDVKYLDYQRLNQILTNYAWSIKKLLTDQSIISGLSSEDSDEILFRSGLHPAKSTLDLSISEKQLLYKSIFSYLKENLSLYMNQIGDYFLTAKERNNYVYVVERICRKCGTIIENIEVDFRKTYFCPVCQR